MSVQHRGTHPYHANDTIENTLLAAYYLSFSVTANLPGNVPSILAAAFRRQLRITVPVGDDTEAYTYESQSQGAAFIILLKVLKHILRRPALTPDARRLVMHARMTLIRGPELSMNIHLNEGDYLPDRVYTLLQGTVWSILMQAGADPDLGDTERKIYTNDDKCLWFLCKKFFFSHQVAEHDGEVLSYFNVCPFFHRSYAGRLFTRDFIRRGSSLYSLVRSPPVIAHTTSDGWANVLVTPHGVYGQGNNRHARFGGIPCETMPLRRLKFPACPRIQQFERRLPPWHKDKLVRQVVMEETCTLVLTPVGLAVAGADCAWATGDDVVDKAVFHPVPLPNNFVPDRIISSLNTVVLTLGDRQFISGTNCTGQLGLGHREPMSGFVQCPFHVESIVSTPQFSIFITSAMFLFAGRVPDVLASPTAGGLLPGYAASALCTTATPLLFNRPVKRIYINLFRLYYVIQGETVCLDFHCQYGKFTVPFEAVAVARTTIFKDTFGIWHKVVRVTHGVASFVRLEPGHFPEKRHVMQLEPV
ncbi:hypothetical protein J8273_1913 [Carpediemonas membranifera]|uniref:Uncharacterized protein n=1 Tax=Carpediemonas membranifera TaxID=201153 RepID=A0A8J6E4F2_9EUKA|nr:hypothetical protein J8273_1913 [Carpediemonas membranifera]|eukprot:KAG9396866.1 hypothetical protein J8273_1913 [Carpediemonas membranifera]